MPDATPLTERIIELELLVTHLQRDFEALNGALVEQRQELDDLKRLLSKLDARVDRMADEEERRDPESEKPPHF